MRKCEDCGCDLAGQQLDLRDPPGSPVLCLVHRAWRRAFGQQLPKVEVPDVE